MQIQPAPADLLVPDPPRRPMTDEERHQEWLRRAQIRAGMLAAGWAPPTDIASLKRKTARRSRVVPNEPTGGIL
jgi:hypothetical protein